jgi:glutathionyl-hydroquinone reductase
MGLLVNGEWHDRWYETDKSGGRFVRDQSAFRNRVPDGSPGPTGNRLLEAAP